jgi:hypothetical protein
MITLLWKWRYSKFFMVACQRNEKLRFPHYYRLYGKCKKTKRYKLLHQALTPQNWWMMFKPEFSKKISRLDESFEEFDDDLNPL